MTELQLAHQAAQAVQFCLAQALMEKKRLTLDDTFNLLSAAMRSQDYLRQLVEAETAAKA